MIVVTGEIEISGEDVWTATVAAVAMMRETEKEPGCLTYRVYADLERPNRFRIYEEWADDAALAAHLGAAHRAEFAKELSGLAVLSREVKKYRVTGETPL